MSGFIWPISRRTWEGWNARGRWRELAQLAEWATGDNPGKLLAWSSSLLTVNYTGTEIPMFNSYMVHADPVEESVPA